MTREQIEKEIDLRLDEPDCEWDGIFNVYSRGFRDGVQWRINSVWHNVKEIPNTGKFVLIQLSGSERVLILFFLKKRDYLNFIKRENVIGWAYVSDLLPERKEETNGGR